MKLQGLEKQLLKKRLKKRYEIFWKENLKEEFGEDSATMQEKIKNAKKDQVIEKQEDPLKLFVASQSVVDFHEKASNFAFFVNHFIFENIDKNNRYPVASGALLSLSCDALSIHQSIRSLCEAGWAFSCSILLRSLMDCLLNVGVICSRKNEAEYMGFKYTHYFLKTALSDRSNSEELRNIYLKQKQEGLDKLNQHNRQKAEEFFRGKQQGYWYNPEYKNPSEILKKFTSSDIQYLYNVYSGSAHGGFSGLKMLRDNPNDIHPHPRADERSQNLAILTSTRFLIEIFTLRGNLEVGGIDILYKKIISEFIELANPFFLNSKIMLLKESKR